MTVTAYLDGARWFGWGEWIADAQGRENGDGRQVRGEWCEAKAVCTERKTRGAAWQNTYLISVEIPRYVRLVSSTDSTRYIPEETDIPHTQQYGAQGIGPRVTNVVLVGFNRLDDDNYNQGGHSTRLDVRLDFVRVSNLPMRDPVTGALLRAGNRDIIRDA